MRTIVGVLLIISGFVLAGAANWFHFQAEADLREKFPEVGDSLEGRIFPRHRLVRELYGDKFPDGRRIRQFWLCAVFGTVLFVSGALIIRFS